MPDRHELFLRPTGREVGAIRQFLSAELVGGVALLIAVLSALILANSPWRTAYQEIITYQIGFGAYRFNVRTWAADGLLAIFFAVAGLELRREMTHGELRNPRRALLPVLAALCGMAVPALIYAILTRTDSLALHAWAIPTSTDLAFTLTILAVTGSKIPVALRAFLLTLAITDDFGAIVLIAVFYSQDLHWRYLVPSLALLLIYGLLQWKGRTSWWLALPLGILAWALMQRSGVHATVAGVLVGLLTNPHRDRKSSSPVERFERVLTPVSTLVSVPFFAFVTIGISINTSDFGALLHDKITSAIVISRLLGKVIGIVGGAFLISKLTKAELNPDLSWWDVGAIGVLGGVGFSVSLLVAVIALGDAPGRLLAGETGILLSGVISALLAVIVLTYRNKKHHQRQESAH